KRAVDRAVAVVAVGGPEAGRLLVVPAGEVVLVDDLRVLAGRGVVGGVGAAGEARGAPPAGPIPALPVPLSRSPGRELRVGAVGPLGVVARVEVADVLVV